MKKIFFLLVLSSCASFLLKAQKHDNFWELGAFNYPSLGFKTMQIQFTHDTMQIDTVTREMNFMFTHATMSNAQGNILFYSNGIYVANSVGDTMLNGSGLNPGQRATEQYIYGMNIAQGILALPDPLDTTIYHLFHQTIDAINWGTATYPLRLYYSVVDMKLDGGKGGLALKNNIILNDTLNSNIIGIRHANGRDWWVIKQCPYSYDYYTFLLGISGLSNATKHSIEVPPLCDIYNHVGISTDGTLLAGYQRDIGVKLFHFDRCLGLFTSGQTINIAGIQSHIRVGGCAFSPNSKYLYVASQEELYQYDLTAPNITASRQTIGIFDGLQNPQGAAFNCIYLAPNNKIYVCSIGQSKSMSVINSPDSLGTACNFVQHGLQLNYINNGTVPNYVNYRLGALIGSACDTLLSNQSAVSSHQVKVYPNPAQQVITIDLARVANDLNCKIYTILGQEVYQSPIKQKETQVFVGNWAKGVYFYEVSSENQKQYGKIIIE